MIKKKSIIFVICLILISIGGIILILFASSRMGPGISPDSVAYIAAARNILNGHGVSILYNTDGTIPLSLWQPVNPETINNVFMWPPAYPFLLSAIGIFGLNIITGARWLNAILFGINIFTITLLIKKVTNSIILPLLSAILLVFSVDLVLIHYMIWSEPLFICFSVSGLFLLVKYLNNNKIGYLCYSSILLGLAFFTKYSGVSLIITGLIVILFLRQNKFYKKITHSIIFISISCVPIAFWFIRLSFLSNGSNIRNLNFNLINKDEIIIMLQNITKWLLPGRIPLNHSLIVFGIIVILIGDIVKCCG